MKYRRMPIEIESPEQMGYASIRCNLTESSVRDLTMDQLDLDLGSLIVAYTDHLGKPELRQRIAADGVGLTPVDVLVTSGAATALFIIATTLLDTSSRLLVMRPNYATNIETPRAIGCTVDFMDLQFEQGYRFDPERLEALVQPGTRLISLTTPHNPTGTTMSEADLWAAIRVAEKHDCYLLVDETYREMNFSGVTPVAASLSSRCISVASMSKSYGLPGIRMGWIVTRDPELQRAFLAAKEQICICNSIVDEEIADRVLANKSRILAPILKRNREAFEEMRAWIGRQVEMEWVEPQGGVVSFPRIKPGSRVQVDRFYHILNQKYSTYVGPGHWFEQDRRSMRVGYAWPKPEELTDGLANIEHALEEAGDI